MKILFLPAYSYPEKVASSHLADDRNRAIADAGYKMLVYAPSPCRGISTQEAKKHKKIKKTFLYDGQLELRRFSLFSEKQNSLLRGFRYLLCSTIQLCKGIFARNIDVIFISSTPPIQGAVGAILRKIRRKPLIYNLQDIFPDSLVSTGLTKERSFLWKFGRAIENFTYRNSDKIIVISEDFKENLLRKGIPEHKIEVIYNWIDENQVVSVPKEKNVLFERYGLNPKKFYVTYCGNIGLTQNMDLLLEVAQNLLTEEKEIHFVLVGEGAYKKEVEKIIQKKGLTNVTLLPYQPYSDISHVFSLGDVGLVISKKGVGTNSVPSKTWSIMSSSCPVLMNFDENELKTIITKEKCGIFTYAGDKVAFEKAIVELYHNPSLRKEYGKNGRAFIEKKLTKDIGTSKIIEVLNAYR